MNFISAKGDLLYIYSVGTLLSSNCMGRGEAILSVTLMNSFQELTKAATTEWNSFDEGKRQEYHKRREHEMAKFDTELSNYQSVCEVCRFTH